MKFTIENAMKYFQDLPYYFFAQDMSKDSKTVFAMVFYRPAAPQYLAVSVLTCDLELKANRGVEERLLISRVRNAIHALSQFEDWPELAAAAEVKLKSIA